MKKGILVLVLALFFSCGNKSKKGVDYAKKRSSTSSSNLAHPGKKLLEKHCFLCHNTTTKHDERIAPPMIAVKAFYKTEGISKENFIKNFVDFAKNPTIKKAKLHNAVKRFNLTPKQQFKEEDLKQIAEYVYDYQIEEPVWFKAHFKEKHGTTYDNSGKKIGKVNAMKTPEDIGLQYALGTKKVLGKNLMGTIQKKGTLEALQFCNQKAYPLTDSMSVKFKATIKRVSDKPRNPKNTANTKELAIINQYKKIVADKADVKPITEVVDGNTQFYYPIVTNTMCLQCHGKPKEQIQPATLHKLAELYPKDKAKGYDANQVRGIWSITFKNK